MGKAFVLGDNISTDALAPGRYLRAEAREMASHCLETVAPEFAESVSPGDILVAGANFGMGSSREQAAGSLKLLGIEVVLARSVARTFYRNAINLGLPVLLWEQHESVDADDELGVEVGTGRIHNVTRSQWYQVEPLPDALMAIVRDGGLVPHLSKAFSNRDASGGSSNE